MIQDIGIVDTKKIISTIKEIYNFDFSDYSLTTFKRRILKVINKLNYSSISDFIDNLSISSIFEKIKYEITIDTTEMFRDPPVWREIKNKYIPELYKNRDVKIWIPEISSGDDLFSFAIVLKEIGLLENMKIIATGICAKKIDKIKQGGVFDIKKMEVCEANYKRYNGQFALNNYYTIKNNKVFFDINLIKRVEFREHSIINEEPPSSFRMIIFRNKMLYYNQTLQDRIAQKVYNSLLPGGLIFIGTKETFETTGIANKLNLLNRVEKIYKKREI